MDLQTKLKAFCECELQRAWYEYDIAYNRYLQTRSAYDLAISTECGQRYAAAKRICTNVLDIIQYHFYLGDKS